MTKEELGDPRLAILIMPERDILKEKHYLIELEFIFFEFDGDSLPFLYFYPKRVFFTCLKLILIISQTKNHHGF